MLTDCGLVDFDWDEWNQTERDEQCGARSEAREKREVRGERKSTS